MIHLPLILAASLVSHSHVKYRTVSVSHESMVVQNREIDRLRLPRIVNDNQLHQLENTGELIRIYDTDMLKVAPNIKPDRRYTKLSTLVFLLEFSRSFYSKFKTPLFVNSAVRTVEQQNVLRRTNMYAAKSTGCLPSAHLSGIAVDLAKRRYNKAQRKWLVYQLKCLKNLGFIELINEPTNYHVAVMESYYDSYLEIANYNYDNSEPFLLTSGLFGQGSEELWSRLH